MKYMYKVILVILSFYTCVALKAINNPDNIMIEVASAFSGQPGDTCYVVESIVLNGNNYIIAAGNVVDNISLRLYAVDAYQQLCTQVNSGIAGFDRQPGATVHSLSSISINEEIFLVVGGDALEGISAHLYRYNSQDALFVEVIGAFEVQHNSTINTVSWYTDGNRYYLVTAGMILDGVSMRLYQIDIPGLLAGNAVDTVKIARTGIMGFDLQHQSLVTSIDWITDGQTIYLAVGGQSDNEIFLRLYQLDQDALLFTALRYAVSRQPTFCVQTVRMLSFNEKNYLLVGQVNNDAISTRLYRFVPQVALLNEMPTAFDFQLKNDVLSSDFCSQFFQGLLVVAGTEMDSITTLLYQFDSATETFIAYPLNRYPHHGAQVNCVRFVEINNRFYAVLSGDNAPNNISLRLYVLDNI